MVTTETAMTNGCENGNGHATAMDLTTQVSNGTHHTNSTTAPVVSSAKLSSATTSAGVPNALSVGTPTKDGHLQGSLASDPQLSPNSLRRRSTRASALKAAEKIKLKDDIVQENNQGHMGTGNHEESDEEEGEIDDSEEPETKRRKLANGYALDQYGHKFGIRERNGDVYALTSESEISSLNESELDSLKTSYDKLVNAELTPEQLYERNLMIKKTEAELRMEEAKLTMLRKIKSSQALQEQQAARSAAQSLMNRGTGPGAYKPVVAQPLAGGHRSTSTPTTTNGKASATSNNVAHKPNPLLTMAGMTPAQQQELVNRLTQQPQLAQQAITQLLAHARQGGANAQQATCLAQFISQFQDQQKTQQAAEKLKEQQEKAQQAAAALAAQQAQAALAAQAQAAISANQASSINSASSTAQGSTNAAVNLAVNSAAAQHAKALAAQSPAQRAAAARAAFRQQADKQLMQLNGPKAPPPDMFFIPNGNQPDFGYLVGLDLVVQRVLKDKQVFAPISEPCYECEECNSDYSPSWKAIGNSEQEMHLYCERCVHEAQKKKIRNDHTSLLRKAFAKINMQEKDFDKQIEDGKLDAALAAACAQVAQQQAALNRAAGVSTPQPQNLTTRSNAGSSANLTSSASTPALNRTPTVPVNRPSQASATSTPKTSQPSTSSGKKTSSSTSSSASMTMQQLQQLMSMNTALATNPMFSAMMRGAATNPMQMMQMMQMWNPTNSIMASQMMRQMAAASSGAGATPTSQAAAQQAAAIQNMSAMAMMSQAAAAQQAAVASAAAAANTHTTSTTSARPSTSTSSSSSSNAAASNQTNAMQQQQLAVLAAALGMTPAAFTAQLMTPGAAARLQAQMQASPQARMLLELLKNMSQTQGGKK